MIKKSVLPKGVRLTRSNRIMLMNTPAGTYAPLGSVEIKGMRLPAFDKNRIIAKHDFMVFDLLDMVYLRGTGVPQSADNWATRLWKIARARRAFPVSGTGS